MEIKVKTKDGKLIKADHYIMASFYVKLLYPEIYDFERNIWGSYSSDSNFVIIPLSQIKIITGSGKAKEFGGV